MVQPWTDLGMKRKDSLTQGQSLNPGKPWQILDNHGKPWKTWDCRRITTKTVENLGIPWNFRKILENLGLSWNK